MTNPLPVLTARDIIGVPGVAPLDSTQPAPRLIVDPPLPGPLSFGRVVIQYRAENLLKLRRIAEGIITGQRREIDAMRLALGRPLHAQSPAPTQNRAVKP